MTLKQAKKIARELGFTLRMVMGEYRVCPRNEPTDDKAYYTNDLQDAVDTMRNWQ